jgi:hypothetical protein
LISPVSSLNAPCRNASSSVSSNEGGFSTGDDGEKLSGGIFDGVRDSKGASLDRRLEARDSRVGTGVSSVGDEGAGITTVVT